MHLIRNVFILSVISLLLVGSAGIDVFKHICKEDGVTVSLFVEADHHCKQEAVSCCSGHDEKDCCDDEVQRVQIQPQYFNDFFLPQFAIVQLQEVQIHHYESNEPVEEFSLASYPQPPPLSGRQILSKKQVWVI